MNYNSMNETGDFNFEYDIIEDTEEVDIQDPNCHDNSYLNNLDTEEVEEAEPMFELPLTVFTDGGHKREIMETITEDLSTTEIMELIYMAIDENPSLIHPTNPVQTIENLELAISNHGV